MLLLPLLCACADEIVCGSGTVRSGTQCVTATPVQPCGDGGVVVGGNCYLNPEVLCGPDSVWDPVMLRCKGNGSGGCASMCGPADSRKVCVSGHVVSFISPTMNATSQSGLRVRAYDPIAFAVDPPHATVLGMSDVRDDGCYTIDGIDRPGTSLIAVSVTDAGNAMGDQYVLAGVGAVLQPDHNVDLQAYYIERATEQGWEMLPPAGCPSLLECGIWIGWFLDAAGHPVAGVTPSRPGDEPLSEEIFCFRGDRSHLSTEDATDATGLCMIVRDHIGTHTGRCGGGPCSPPFPAVMAGTAPRVVFIQPMQQQ